MAQHTPLHWLNLGIHIAFGTACLGLGLIAILSSKGGRLHTRSGTLFIYSYLVVIITASIGLLLFDFRSFLAVVTLLSFYDVFAGYRALQLRGARPQAIDRILSVIGILTPWIFIAIMRRLHLPWVPVLTWSILGGLIGVAGYDLLRNVLPLPWLRRVWVQEHLVKMMGAYIAVTSAFAGTVFVRWMPWSAILPSVLGTAVSIAFLLIGPRAWSAPAPKSSLPNPQPPIGVILSEGEGPPLANLPRLTPPPTPVIPTEGTALRRATAPSPHAALALASLVLALYPLNPLP